MTDEQFAKVEQELINRLESLNYQYEDKDAFTLRFSADRAEHRIFNGINREEIPEGLHEVFVNMACGEFLYSKDSTMSDEQKSLIVKRVTAGEETVEFDVNTQKKFVNYVFHLLTDGEKEFSRYRELVW